LWGRGHLREWEILGMKPMILTTVAVPVERAQDVDVDEQLVVKVLISL
jgi:hypothetical protein